MAKKTIYQPRKDSIGVYRIVVEYEYFPGFALSQKQKCIKSLHDTACRKYGISNILEVSTKSCSDCGTSLSAFNLSYNNYSVEQLFQAGKIFENGGPYLDLLDKTSKEAKTDPRLKSSGKIIGFRLKDINFPTEPKTFFYDWLYSNALLQNKDIFKEALKFEAFSDIEFNEKKSLNCQAYSLALVCSMIKKQPAIIERMYIDKEDFLNLCLNEYMTRTTNSRTIKLYKSLNSIL